MNVLQQPWLGNLHECLPPHWAGVVLTVVSVLCGAVIGMERMRAEKPAGLRTMILICLGAAIFTQASIWLAAPTGDPTRIAAQVVSGIGFLGAGAIIQARGQIIGVTTGAGIWAMAAVGVVIGGGYAAAGVFFTALIYFTLAAAKLLDGMAAGRCQFETLVIRYDPDHGKTRLAIQGVIDDHQVESPIRFDEPPDGPCEATLRVCQLHREHRLFTAYLPDIKAINEIRILPAGRGRS